MKKSIFTIVLVGIISFSYVLAANAATVTFTKPAVKVNTTSEESALTKKVKELEQAKKDALDKQAQKQQEAKAKQDALKKDIENQKNVLKNKQDSIKNDINKKTNDLKAKQEANKQAAQAKQQQRKDAIKSLKDSFKN